MYIFQDKRILFLFAIVVLFFVAGVRLFSASSNGIIDEKEIKFAFQKRGIVDVRSFGANGDGLLDDTEPLNRAIKFVFDNGGGKLKIHDGIFLISSPLKMYSGVQLIGVGAGVSIIKADSSWVGAGMLQFNNPTQNAIIESLTIDGNKSENPFKKHFGLDGYTGHSVVSNLIVKSVEVKNTSEHGIAFAAGVTNVIFDGCNVHHNGDINHAAGIYTSGASNIAFHNCIFENNYEHGLYLGGRDFFLANCTAKYNGGVGISLRGTGSSVIGCLITENGARLDVSGGGMSVHANGDTFIKNITVKQNIIRNNSAIDREVAFTKVENLVFTDNLVGDRSSSPRTILIDSNCKNILIDSNIIQGGAALIRIQGTFIEDISIKNNILRGTGATNIYGIVISNKLGSDIKNIIITGNTILLVNDAIYIYRSVGVKGNIFCRDNNFKEIGRYKVYDTAKDIDNCTQNP